MAALPSSVSLAVLALMSMNLFFLSEAQEAEEDNPCKKHLRSYQGHSEMGSNWGSNVVLLILFFLSVVGLGGYALTCICGSKELCAAEGCSEFCPNAVEMGSSRCASPTPTCNRATARSRSPMCVEAQQAYAQQLTSMEKMMMGFLGEIRDRRKAVETVLGHKLGAPGQDCNQSKLAITVYEIADREESRRAK